MKRIRSLDAPTPGLADYCRVERDHPSWEGFRSHDDGAAYSELRESLIQQQRGLCGYCEIALKPGDIQVDHVVPRSAGGEELEAGNLIACCRGGTKQPKPRGASRRVNRLNRSCGEAKGDRTDATFLDPRDLPATLSLFRVDAGGRIDANRRGCAAEGVQLTRVRDTIEMLGLNAGRLQDARTVLWARLLEVSNQLAADRDRWEAWMRSVLLARDDGLLMEFFSTSRSFFGSAAEATLAEAPEAWV